MLQIACLAILTRILQNFFRLSQNLQRFRRCYLTENRSSKSNQRDAGFGGMKIVQITPGAGGMFCGGCFRDNALVAELRRQGHSTLMIPLYLPLTLDEPDQSQDVPIF